MGKRELENYYSVAELAEALSVTKGYLWKKVHKNEIRVCRIDGMIRIPVSAIKEMLDKVA